MRCHNCGERLDLVAKICYKCDKPSNEDQTKLQVYYKKSLMHPASQYEKPTGWLRYVIFMQWLYFLILFTLTILYGYNYPFVYLFWTPIVAFQFWLARMVRRYHNGARYTIVAIASLQFLSSFFTIIGAILPGLVLYALLKHEPTVAKFARNNGKPLQSHTISVST